MIVDVTYHVPGSTRLFCEVDGDDLSMRATSARSCMAVLERERRHDVDSSSWSWRRSFDELDDRCRVAPAV